MVGGGIGSLAAAAFLIRDRHIQTRNHVMSYQVQAPHFNNDNNGKALPRGDRVAVLLAGYGEVQSYRDLNRYDRAATQYIAAQFIPIPEWLYPLAGKILALQDLYNFKVKHHQFISPENEIFEKQRLGIETQLQDRWGDSSEGTRREQIRVFKGFYFCQPYLLSATSWVA